MAFTAVRTNAQVIEFSGTSVSVPITTPATNNLLVVHLESEGNSLNVSSVTDDVGNTYSLSSKLTNGSRSIYQAFAVQVNAGATSLTINLDAAITGYFAAGADEFSGGKLTNVAIFDVSTTGTGSSSPGSVSTLTPAATGELIVGTIGIAGANIIAGSGYTKYSTGDGGLYSQYKLSSASSETAPFTIISTPDYLEIATAFIPNAITRSFGVINGA